MKRMHSDQDQSSQKRVCSDEVSLAAPVVGVTQRSPPPTLGIDDNFSHSDEENDDDDDEEEEVDTDDYIDENNDVHYDDDDDEEEEEVDTDDYIDENNDVHYDDDDDEEEDVDTDDYIDENNDVHYDDDDEEEEEVDTDYIDENSDVHYDDNDDEEEEEVDDVNDVKYKLHIPWCAKSERYKPLLAQVEKRQESKQVGHYHFHEKSIASGAFGVVHAGINSKDGREVAIKSIRKDHIVRPEDHREIRNLTKLSDCEQVVKYLDFTEDKSFVYIILELMEGNLDEYLDSAPDTKHDVKLSNDVVKGIKFLHQNGITHRDLKPGNILYKTTPLCLKIADFGLSSESDFSSLQPTVMHTNAGTRCWMAPELMKSKDKINHTERSDMFACGLLLHHILARKRHPFAPDDVTSKGEFEVVIETECNIMGSRPSISDKLSAEASHLVSRMIAEDKDQRVTATDALAHPFFWTNYKKKQFIEAVGNQKEIAVPRRKVSTSVVETDLESSFAPHRTAIGCWNAVVPISQIYNEMTSSPKSRKYDVTSCVELVRFIRNAYAHVSDVSHPTPFRTKLLEDFVFFDHFPWLVMEVYKAVTNAEWHQTREEVKAAMQSK